MVADPCPNPATNTADHRTDTPVTLPTIVATQQAFGHVNPRIRPPRSGNFGLEQTYSHAVSLDAYRLSPDHVNEILSQAGLAVHARLRRKPDEPEKTQQAYLLARKPMAS